MPGDIHEGPGLGPFPFSGVEQPTRSGPGQPARQGIPVGFWIEQGEPRKRNPVGSGGTERRPRAPALMLGRKSHRLPRRAPRPPSIQEAVREHRCCFEPGVQVPVPRKSPGPAPTAVSRPDPHLPSVSSPDSGECGGRSIPPPRPPAPPGKPRSLPGSRSGRKPAPRSGGSSPGTGVPATAHYPPGPAWIESRTPYPYEGPSKPI